jgi:hypothetical protein
MPDAAAAAAAAAAAEWSPAEGVLSVDMLAGGWLLCAAAGVRPCCVLSCSLWAAVNSGTPATSDTLVSAAVAAGTRAEVACYVVVLPVESGYGARTQQVIEKHGMLRTALHNAWREA